MKRNCNNCQKEYNADERNIKRGWGLCCSKSCAASLREKSKPTYNAERVERNNVKREFWTDKFSNGIVTARTAEGYRIIGGVAYDEFDDPVYNYDPYEDALDHGQE